MKTIAITTATLGTATGTLTSNASTPTDGDTITIGNKTYTLKTTLGTTEGQVLIGGSAANALANLKKAINFDSADGVHPANTKYYCAAAHTQVSAGTLGATTLVVNALTAGFAGNVATTKITATTAHLSWGAATLTGGEVITIVGSVSDTTPAQPAQQVTIGEFPSGNANWSRGHRITSAALQCLRGSTFVGMALEGWAKIAYTLENALTYVPKINTQPEADSCVQSSTAATFTVDASSEITATYLWQYSTDNETWLTATGTVAGCAYSGGTTATLTCTPTSAGADGYYHRCQITNALGTTNSESAILTIT